MSTLFDPEGEYESEAEEGIDSGEDRSPEMVRDQTARALPQIDTVQPIRSEEDEPYVFRFEVGPAILYQLLEKLRGLPNHSMSEGLEAEHPGFYQLLLDEKPVYIGKTSRAIGARMREHVRKLRGRLSTERVTCRFAYVEDPSLVDVSENVLIRFFDELEATEWNHSGFGSKATGYGRAGQSTSDWGAQYPPDLDWPVEAGAGEEQTLKQIIDQLNRGAPITFSIPRKYRKAFDADHSNTIVEKITTMPFSEWVQWVEERLAPEWRIEKTSTGWYVTKKE